MRYRAPNGVSLSAIKATAKKGNRALLYCNSCGGELPCISCARKFRAKVGLGREPKEHDEKELELSPDTALAAKLIREGKLVPPEGMRQLPAWTPSEKRKRLAIAYKPVRVARTRLIGSERIIKELN